ncbi:hypothetical protein [Companilactobacillus musae]|uniref:hypothetical protein n=1 Tax=Companilactobacillus musae TaxID=1903258 RepID=UPI0013C32EE2|nr:hypothetical protein [Companilactobacillus musae]
MKLIQKSLLFASLVAVGASITTIPIISSKTIEAASTSYENLNTTGFYYRIANDKLIKASDVKVITDDTQEDSNMISTAVANNFRLEVTVPKASLYDLKGNKLTHHLTKDTICPIGSRDAFYNSTYYKVSKDKMIQVSDSTWL